MSELCNFRDGLRKNPPVEDWQREPLICLMILSIDLVLEIWRHTPKKSPSAIKEFVYVLGEETCR